MDPTALPPDALAAFQDGPLTERHIQVVDGVPTLVGVGVSVESIVSTYARTGGDLAEVHADHPHVPLYLIRRAIVYACNEWLLIREWSA
ncbi:MAG: DUF433 domain-containing protein [Myxococcota bacterium]